MSQKRSVLIVEDSKFYQRILANVLEEFALYFAASAGEALVKSKILNPEIIFLDVGLPDAKGTDIIKKLLETVPDTYIVMVTGDNTIDTIKSSLSSGASGYIIKPYSKTKIDEALAMWRKRKGITS
jgi:two-component system chemotaxis response regulator CheY